MSPGKSPRPGSRRRTSSSCACTSRRSQRSAPHVETTRNNDPRQGVRAAAIVLAALLALRPAAARLDEANPRPEDWTVTEAMIPMRDGVKLHTKIFAPKDRKRAAARSSCAHAVRHRRRRGRGSSRRTEDARRRRLHLRVPGHPRAVRVGGQFVMQRPPRDPGDTKAIDESTDTYDTIDWLLEERAATTTAASACSASPTPGWTTIMGALDPHPALKAVSPQASPADMFLGDDFHHNGAFRLSYGFEYAAMMESGKDVQQLRVRPLRHLRLVSGARVARRTSTRSTSRARSRPGTTSSRIPTTTSSGRGRR